MKCAVCDIDVPPGWFDLYSSNSMWCDKCGTAMEYLPVRYDGMKDGRHYFIVKHPFFCTNAECGALLEHISWRCTANDCIFGDNNV